MKELRGADYGELEVVLTISPASLGTKELVFALYSSGRVIYPDGHSFREYEAVTLSPAERKTLVGDLPLDRVGALHPPERFGSDGATECIEVWSHGAHKRDCIWGGIDLPVVQGDPDPQPTPPDMVKIWKRLTHFKSPKAKPWVASEIEVEVFKWDNPSCGIATPEFWPKGWPHPRPAKKRSRPDLIGTLTLPGTAMPELERLRAKTTSSGCIEPVMLGDTFCYFVDRVRFPSEDAWNPPAAGR